jgi:NitT/TauT family transport system ATP-binding protein
MDEPFSNLDAFTAEYLRSEVIQLWAEKKLGIQSIFLISHDIYEVAYMADRIIVLGANPGSIRDIIENKLPRPRNYRSPEFLNLVEQLHASYGKMEPPGPKPLSKETILPLPPVEPAAILGLLHFLDHIGGAKDIFQIGPEIHQHFDKVSTVLQAAALLELITIDQQTASLTNTGRSFLHSNDRHTIWKNQLLTIPLFIKTLELLQQHPHLHKHDLLQLFAQQLPDQNASDQFHLLIHWATYGKLLSYHPLSQTLTQPLQKNHS